MGTNISSADRNYSLDLLKCLAAVIVTYSHMEPQFGDYGFLATGGSFGDCLFFFCSGFALLLSKRNTTFFNWYKRRINRIYPTVFAWALICYFVFSSNWNIFYILTSGGGYFVQCIMLFYLLFYPLKKLSLRQLVFVAFLIYLICSCVYFLLDHSDKAIMYAWTWSQYFLPMLLGAMIGKAYAEGVTYPMKDLGVPATLVLMIVSVVSYYLLMYATKKYVALEVLSPLIIIPQLGATFGFYRLCSCRISGVLYHHRILHPIIMFVGGICLEIYIVQPDILASFPLMTLFPFNLIVVFLMILSAAFFLKMLSRLWKQTFMEGDYYWKDIVKPY